MTATTLMADEVGPDGIARYRTKYKVIVHSHNADNPINLSSSVIRVSSSKNLKSVGSLSVSLVGDRNLLNSVNPNDYINVYVSRGDGQGWTRQFFGFVDQIEESYSAGGAPQTIYGLQCSDFSKALDRTQIYFNPMVASREDFDGGFVGTPNIAGMALMSRGVIMNGSPADMVLNVLLLLLGFGSQFTLPTSYSPRMVSLARRNRADFLLNRLGNDVRSQIVAAGGYQAFLEEVRQGLSLTSSVDTLVDPQGRNSSEVMRAERARFSSEVANRLGGTGSGVGEQGLRMGLERGIEAYSALNTTLAGYPPTLLDIIDLFTFVERSATDGFFAGASMWERQGNVTSFLRSITNEIVNEMFFDLRPLSRGGGLTSGTDFARDLDEIDGNAGADGEYNGVQYVPAVVFREYPFSTIAGVDGSGISLSLRGSTETPEETPNLGRIHFGAIFSDQPSVPGRHVIKIPTINSADWLEGRSDKLGAKHLDVAVVYDNELISTKFTRSDSDHYNLLEIISDAMLAEAGRFYMQDLLPIITPTHIVRHGLRVRSLQTRAARWPVSVVNTQQPQPTEEQREDSAPQAPAAVEAPAGTSRFPVDVAFDSGTGRQISGALSSPYGYRSRYYEPPQPDPNNPTASPPLRPFNKVSLVPPGESIWRFHNGVDFTGPVGTPVYAVRDGWVVCASPARDVVTSGRNIGSGRPTPGFNGYGGTVIIYHDQDSPDSPPDTTAPGAIFTLYAHLYKIEPKFLQGNSTAAASRMSKELNARGTYVKQRVRAGEKIGEIGKTGFVDRVMAPHLHFEVMVKRGTSVYPSQQPRLTPDMLKSDSQRAANGGWAPASTPLGGPTQVSASKPPLPDPNEAISQDPVPYLTRWVGTSPTAGSDDTDPTTGASPVPGVADTDTAYDGDADEFVDLAEVPPSPTAESTEPASTQPATTVQVGHVDTPDVRRQLARWGLLNDHWYQHNLEYMSGTIEMRGAPEIRVGYRLDLADRNMSFYVEGVSHHWAYEKQMVTTLHVTRGQPNNPYPSYVLPYIKGFDPTRTQRQTGSRLSKYFIIPDPVAVRRGLRLERGQAGSHDVNVTPAAARATGWVNEVDMAGEHGSVGERYGEQIIPAQSISSAPPDTAALLSESDLDRAEISSILEGSGTNIDAIETNPQGGITDGVISDLFRNMG